MMPDDRVMQDDERYTRLGVGVAHGIGSAILGGLGGDSGRQGAVALGELEKTALDAGFGNRISPTTNIYAKVSNNQPAQPKPAEYKPAIETQIAVNPAMSDNSNIGV